mmetsp:Transcript_16240/g.31804  ORF Transcript_16240/g.31804 Transcript_16240/m.31804 type:complete len:479 (+) Transcript_16240:41-1477(+)
MPADPLDDVDLADWVLVSGDRLIDECKATTATTSQVLLATPEGIRKPTDISPVQEPPVDVQKPLAVSVDGLVPGLAKAPPQAQLLPPSDPRPGERELVLAPRPSAVQASNVQAQAPVQAKMQAEVMRAASSPERDQAQAPTQAQMPRERQHRTLTFLHLSREEQDVELIRWAEARPSAKHLSSLSAFNTLVEHLEDPRDAVDWCVSLVDDINMLAERHLDREFQDICPARIVGGDAKGMDCLLTTATTVNTGVSQAMQAKRRALRAELSKLMKERAVVPRSLLQTLAAESLRRLARKASENTWDMHSKVPASVTLTFDSRPLGMTPARSTTDETTLGYVIEKVNRSDPSKPAARLGVQPGWVGVRLNGSDVRSLPLDRIQNLLREAPLPLTFEFEVPPKGGRKEHQPLRYGEPARAPKPQMEAWDLPAGAPAIVPIPLCGDVCTAGPTTVEPVTSEPTSQVTAAMDSRCPGCWEDPDW